MKWKWHGEGNIPALPREPTEREAFCCRCKEEFPVNKYDFWQMGQLNKLKQAPKHIRDQYRGYLNSEVDGEGYLCGNCYFDLTAIE